VADPAPLYRLKASSYIWITRVQGLSSTLVTSSSQLEPFRFRPSESTGSYPERSDDVELLTLSHHEKSV
jgi:hypothetical protein